MSIRMGLFGNAGNAGCPNRISKTHARKLAQTSPSQRKVMYVQTKGNKIEYRNLVYRKPEMSCSIRLSRVNHDSPKRFLAGFISTMRYQSKMSRDTRKNIYFTRILEMRRARAPGQSGTLKYCKSPTFGANILNHTYPARHVVSRKTIPEVKQQTPPQLCT